LKITDIELVVVGTPWRELTFIELITDEGLRGLAEARMVNKTDTLIACVKEMGARYVIGMDPFDVERLASNFHVLEYGRVGEIAATTLALFDVACWDLMGQALEQPVWRLLGGKTRDRVPAYANGWYLNDRAPGPIAEAAARVAERGYRGLKIDPFGAVAGAIDPEQLRHSLNIVRGVRAAVGPDVALMIEMHGRFDASTAVQVVSVLEEHQPTWIEEPVSLYHLSSLRHVRAKTNLPIASGERMHVLPEFVPLFEEGLIDVVQADLTHFGGFTGLRKLAALAQAYGLPLAPHNVCGPIGTAANIHFAAATPNYKILEHFNDFADPWVASLVDRAPTLDAATGAFEVPEAPGLGVRLNREECALHPRTQAFFNLFEDGWERRAGTGVEAVALDDAWMPGELD
jgi:galactonate dehydratase